MVLSSSRKTCSHIYLLILLILVSTTLASSGDRLPEYQSCVSSCVSTSCSNSASLPLILRVTQWSCLDDCKYSCTHLVTDVLLARSRAEGTDPKVHQFHGKWPFWRLAGMQEPASVLFSLGNLWIHVKGFKALRKRVPREHPLRSMLLTWSVLSMNAWVWSAVFHTRGAVDHPLFQCLPSDLYFNHTSRYPKNGKIRLLLCRSCHHLGSSFHRRAFLLPLVFLVSTIPPMDDTLHPNLPHPHCLPHSPSPFRLFVQHGVQSCSWHHAQSSLANVRLPLALDALPTFSLSL